MGQCVVRLYTGIVFAVLLCGLGGEAAHSQCALPSQPYTKTSPSVSKVSSTTIYLDVSGSMRGFVAPPRSSQANRYAAEVAIFPDIIRALPATLARHDAPGAAKPFGTAIGGEVGLDKIAAVATDPRSYGRSKNGGLGGASHIDLVLREIAGSQPDTVAVVATDLFLSQDTLYGSTQSRLSGPLADLLRSGRSVGVLAVRSRFTEDVVDLPVSKRYAGVVARPVFFLIIGPDAAVTATRNAIVTSHLQGPDKQWRFARFSSRLGEKTVELNPVGGWQGVAPIRGNLLPVSQQSVKIPQLQFDAMPAVWSAALPATVGDADTVRVKTGPRLWVYSDTSNQCRFAEGVPADNLLAVSGQRLRLDLPRSTILPRQTYLLRGAMVAEAIDETAEPFLWMRDWSFDVTSETELVAKRPTFFPTLNLFGLGQTMARVALADMVDRKVAMVTFEIAARLGN